MGISEYIASRLPIFNLPDLLNVHHDNPLGLDPIIQLVVILFSVSVMAYFNFLIRYRDKQQYYPLLYILFGFSIIFILYYSFQSCLPIVNGDPCVGWFCRAEIVGIGWTIVNVILLMFVVYSLLCAVMQIVAQLSVEAKMIEGKKWKEWKIALGLFLLGITVVCTTQYINLTIPAWALIATSAALLIFCLVKIVLDSARCHNILWGSLIGITYYVGIMSIMLLTIEVLCAIPPVAVPLIVILSLAKARKKKVKTK